MLLTQHCHKKAMKSVHSEEGILWLVLWGMSAHIWFALAITQPGGKAEGTKLFPWWPRSTRKRTLLVSLWRASCRPSHLDPRSSSFYSLPRAPHERLSLQYMILGDHFGSKLWLCCVFSTALFTAVRCNQGRPSPLQLDTVSHANRDQRILIWAWLREEIWSFPSALIWLIERPTQWDAGAYL